MDCRNRSGSELPVLTPPFVQDVFGDQRTHSQTSIQFAHQKQTAVGIDTGALEINFQGGVERELKCMVMLLTHWVEASEVFLLASRPHECWRWLDHTITYTNFKEEMWDKDTIAKSREGDYRPEHLMPCDSSWRPSGYYQSLVKEVDHEIQRGLTY